MRSARFPWAFLGFVLPGLVSCGGHELWFEATPKNVCEADTVSIKLDKKNELRMQVSLHPAAEEGGGAPDTLCMLLFSGTGRDAISHNQEVLVFPPSLTSELTFELDEGVGHTVVRSGKWPGNFVMETVACASGEAVTVRHLGREVVLDAGGNPSPGFQGLTLPGDWDVQVSVPPGEEGPPFLTLAFTAVCSPGSQGD